MGKRHGVIGIIALVILLTACGATATTGSTATAATSPTVMPTPTATSGSSTFASLVAACFGPSVSPELVSRSGDFLLSPVTVDELAYPSVMLPDGSPASKPYKLTADGPAAYAADFPNSPITNPGLTEIGGGGFLVSVCNVSSTQPHVLQGVFATIAGFASYSGRLNSWQACDGTMDSHHHLGGGGCGGGVASCDCFHAVFPSAKVGTTVQMTQTQAALNGPGDNSGKLPFTLNPGKSVTLSLGMDTPSAAGIYVFVFGFGFDNASPIYPGSGPRILLAPAAHKWTGPTCQQPALEAQITPTNPETYYICAQ